MKNKRQRINATNVQNDAQLLIPDNPILSEYYTAISQFIHQLNLVDTSFSFDDLLIEIINDAAKVAKHDSNSPSTVVLDANWRLFSNQILLHVQQINQRNQSSKILQCVSAIKEIVAYTNEATPIAQAAKKEHHNVYLLMKKALSHIEQSVSVNDCDRTAIQLRSFKNDLSKVYTKFFQLSQLDRASSLTAMQECKKNVDQILRILAGMNQLYVPPIEFQNLSRFINKLKLKYDVKKVLPGIQRSRTPPSRFSKTAPQRTTFNNSIAYSPPESPDTSSMPRKSSDSSLPNRKIRPSKNQTKEITASPHSKTTQIPNINQQSRSKTPPSKIPSLALSSIRTGKFSPSRKNQLLGNSKSNESTTHQSPRQKSSKIQAPSSLPSSKYRKIITQHSSSSSVNLNENDLQQQDKLSVSSKIPGKRKPESPSSSLSSTQPLSLSNESQKRKSRGEHNKKPSSPISSLSSTANPQFLKKNLNRSQNLSQTQNFTKKKEQQISNLISTAININRAAVNTTSSSSENEKEDISNKSFNFNINQPSFSQDSETDQLVKAVKKAKEHAKQLSPTLEKLQRDLSGGFLLHDDSNSARSPSPPPPPPPQEELNTPLNSIGHQKKNTRSRNVQYDEDKEMEVEIDIDSDDFTNDYINGHNSQRREIRSFDSRQCTNVSKYSFSAIEGAYSEFLEKLKQFDKLLEIHDRIESFMSNVSKFGENGEYEFNAEAELSAIDESIANLICNNNNGNSEFGGNEASFQIGRSLSVLNKQIDESISSNSNFDSILVQYEQIEKMIESIKAMNISNQNQTDKLFLQVINSCIPEFMAAKSTIINYSNFKLKKKAKNDNKSKKVTKRKENDKEELENQNKKLLDEYQSLLTELSNLKEKETNKDNSKNLFENNECCENTINFDADKLNDMDYNELIQIQNNLLSQLTQIQNQHEMQLSQFKNVKEASLSKRIELRSELEIISKQISEIHNLLLASGKDKTVEYQSKIISKFDLKEILMNLIEKENQIVQNISSSDSL